MEQGGNLCKADPPSMHIKCLRWGHCMESGNKVGEVWRWLLLLMLSAMVTLGMATVRCNNQLMRMLLLLMLIECHVNT